MATPEGEGEIYFQLKEQFLYSLAHQKGVDTTSTASQNPEESKDKGQAKSYKLIY